VYDKARHMAPDIDILTLFVIKAIKNLLLKITEKLSQIQGN